MEKACTLTGSELSRSCIKEMWKRDVIKKYPCPHLSSVYALKVPHSSLKEFLLPSSKCELIDCQSSILTGWGTDLACLSIKQWHYISYFSQCVAWKAKGLLIFAGWFSLWSLCRACERKWQFTQATKRISYLSCTAPFFKAPFFQYVFKIELLHVWCTCLCFTENLIDKKLIFDWKRQLCWKHNNPCTISLGYSQKGAVKMSPSSSGQLPEWITGGVCSLYWLK